MFGRVTIEPADKVFSQFIRLRDKKCVRCGSPVKVNDKGLPVSHECSHYFSRGNRSVRFDPDDTDTLCFACHNLWETEKQDKPEYKGDYTKYMIKKLGENGFKILKMKAHTYKKKDKKFELLVAKELLKSELKK